MEAADRLPERAEAVIGGPADLSAPRAGSPSSGAPPLALGNHLPPRPRGPVAPAPLNSGRGPAVRPAEAVSGRRVALAPLHGSS